MKEVSVLSLDGSIAVGSAKKDGMEGACFYRGGVCHFVRTPEGFF